MSYVIAMIMILITCIVIAVLYFLLAPSFDEKVCLFSCKLSDKEFDIGSAVENITVDWILCDNHLLQIRR